MSKHVESVSPETPLAEVVSLMARKAISCVLVREKGIPIGIVSERDLLGALHKILQGKPSPETAGEVMTYPVLTVLESATVHEMMMLVEKNRVRRVVVVDDAGTDIGMVTQTDMIRAHAWDLDLAQQTVTYLLESVAAETQNGQS